MNKFTIPLIIVLGFLLGACQTEQQEELQLVQESEVIAPVASSSIVFIAGYDEGNTTYYQSAKAYFEKNGHRVVSDLFSLKEIIEWLALHKKDSSYNEIHIVSHSNAWRGMSLHTTPDGSRITTERLKVALDNGEISPLNTGIHEQTALIFHSCGLGENTALMQQLQRAFTKETAPTVYASPYFNVFEGKYKGHYLAQPFYAYYPTAQSKGPKALAADFANSYPEQDIDWLKAIRVRAESQVGSVYSYRFNIPVKWTFTFEDKSEMPDLKSPEDIMDFIVEDPDSAMALLEMGIPMEKYRWKHKVKGSQLTILGKTTVMCVLKPIMELGDDGEYQKTEIQNPALYTKVL